jgi:hypothetical protein
MVVTSSLVEMSSERTLWTSLTMQTKHSCFTSCLREIRLPCLAEVNSARALVRALLGASTPAISERAWPPPPTLN